MKSARLLLVATLLGGWLMPSQAYATGGWWDFLDSFSGPGPFTNGWILDQRVACRVEHKDSDSQRPDATGERTDWAAPWTRGGDGRTCLTNGNSVRAYVEIRGGRATTENQALFSDRPNELVGTAAVHTVQGYAMRQFDPALAVGAGAGLLWFTGDNIEGTPRRFVFTPISVAFMPLKLLFRGDQSTRAGFVAVRFEEIAVVGGLQASDFNSRSSSAFTTPSDLVRSVSVTFDVFALLK
jgi:hypothetical protein